MKCHVVGLSYEMMTVNLLLLILEVLRKQRSIYISDVSSSMQTFLLTYNVPVLIYMGKEVGKQEEYKTNFASQFSSHF